MVKFIVGKADADISEAVRGGLVSLLEANSAEQNIIYLVPDQFEYETEKAVYRILEKKGLLNRFYEIRITTFSRLCADILESDGELRPFADDIVKTIIMHKTVSENKSALTVLGKAASRSGFCGKMVKTVSALKTSGVSAADLELSLQAITRIDKSLSENEPIIRKLKETTTLYTHYESLLGDYIDKLDVTGMAADVADKEKSGIFGGANVFVDCFNDFTQSQLKFLKCALRKAENITFGFTAALDSNLDVFRTANGHISRLKREALDAGFSVELVTENLPMRFDEESSLRFVSKYLYQNVKSRELFYGCELMRARSVYEELDYVAAKIKELTLDRGEKNLRYGEIAVLCADMGSYGRYVESAFKKYGIPMFLDMPEPILYQPLINLVVSILNALCKFSVENVMSCVKTRFFAKEKEAEDTEEADFEPDDTIEKDGELYLPDLDVSPKRGKYITLSDKDIDDFESYIYEWDLNTSHLRKPFTLKSKRAENDFRRQTAERVRKAAAVPLLTLQKELKQNGEHINGAEITEKLYKFLLNKVGMFRAIYNRCLNDDHVIDGELSALYQRLWNTLTDIFNKLYDKLSDTVLTLDEYADIFREICAQTTLATPPQVVDSVLVGDIDRTRADNIKAAFIVGASYDAFPTPAGEAGIFSDREMDIIYNKIAHIDNKPALSEIADDLEKIAQVWNSCRREYCLKSTREQYYLSVYRAYRALTLPTEYLCVSCPDCSAEGEEQPVSDVFAEIRGTFVNVKEIRAEKMSERFYCRTLKAVKYRYAVGINSASEDNAMLRRVLEREDGEFVRALDEIREIRSDVAYKNDRSGYFSGRHSLNARTARLLYPASYGATAIEDLDLCKFNFFCTYGLKIDERNKRSFTRSKRGEAIHFVFQNVMKEYSGDPEAFFALTRSRLLSLAKKYLAVYRENETNNDGKEDRRTEYLFNNIANAAADVLIIMQTELFARKYRPKLFELNIKESEEDKHVLIQNEKAVKNEPPAAEIYDTEEIVPSAPKEPETAENPPYLISAPLTLKLKDGSEITIHGVIDRVDSFMAGENEEGKPIAYVRVVDYKSAVHTFDLRNAQNGINIQMLLYLFALRNANKDNPTLEFRAGGVNYIPSTNKGAADEAMQPYSLLAMNYHESGLFIRDDVTQGDLDAYTKTVFDKLDGDSLLDPKKIDSLKNSFVPNSNNTADAACGDELRDDILAKITENLDAVFSGVTDALPLDYYEYIIKPDGRGNYKHKNPCEYCRFGEICGNGGSNVVKLEKLKPPKNGEKPMWENKYFKKGEVSGDGK